MKIVRDYNINNPTDVIEVTSANYIGDFAIRISFNDGNEELVDFKPFLLKSLHPSISKYLNENLFKQFEIINGNLNWNDYDLIFPVHDLYEGSIN
ncbi:DUF2442 domain-containing protein [Mucilaginibacter sp.]|uniref:DUF2442 domain-containing protein n=1 Tax=Mucilaginibacter sp. TaxID=1882438 RepID=UPI00283ADE3A|nr:DUF2442 domain-containing protein [Mucilaginibacter sp.]MDR3695728.1 DUF2442 domain-containing protein [Mucilaginibacter sp.]